jgi:hypothetical protein
MNITMASTQQSVIPTSDDLAETIAPSSLSEPAASDTTKSTQQQQQGIAGRTNYGQWDKIASTLVKDVEQQDEEEEKVEKAKVMY